MTDAPFPTLTPRPSSAGLCSFAVPVDTRTTRQLTINDTDLSWGDESLSLHEITGVRYTTRIEAVAVWHQRLVRRIIVQTNGESMEISFGASDVGDDAEQLQADAYYAVIDTLHTQVEPLLRAIALDRLQRGLRYDIDALSLTQEGILIPSAALARSLVSWERLPSAQFEDGRVIIAADSPTGSLVVGDVSMLAVNAVLLPELCNDAITAFAS